MTRKAEAVLATSAILASNTSTLPITGLAQASARTANFIGLHFFSPVDKMPLVEIIRAGKTGDSCLAKSMRVHAAEAVGRDGAGLIAGGPTGVRPAGLR